VKILLPILALVQLTSANASLVGVMDSGTDLSHRDLTTKAWLNKKEKFGSKVDADGDGLPGNTNGWDFIENSPKVYNNKYNSFITADVKTFFNYYSKVELGTVTQQEMEWLRGHGTDQVFMNKVNFIGGYIHGTHCAGISVKNVNAAKILAMKVIPTVYEEPVAPVQTNGQQQTPPPADTTPAKTIEEFKAELIQSADQQVEQMVGLHGIMNFHKVDVVNQSFGIGFGDAVNFIKAGFIDEVKREPTNAELGALVKTYFDRLLQEGPKMFSAAPETLFTIAAGNDESNNDLYPDYPADIQADNKIVVAATLGYKQLASFSNYGGTKVDVAAPGVAILSTAPTQAYIPLSGTSQATPYVTNIIAAMKDLNPALKARDLKDIVLGTVDVKNWLKGKVKTSGIVNKPRALKAAELAKTMTVDKAISMAKVTIADVPVEKSFTFGKKLNFNMNFKPVRPSLLIKKPVLE